MNKTGLTLCLAVVVTLVATVSQADAQHHRRFRQNRRAIYQGTDAEGMTMSNYDERIGPLSTVGMALHNPYTPERLYTYSNHGVLAQNTHTWNQEQAAGYPWHGNYQYWRYAQPTALVVPPTASYQSSYAWGVGQVRSTPIHHQFGRLNAGMIESGDGTAALRAPYRPSSTDQFGIYPVRAPW